MKWYQPSVSLGKNRVIRDMPVEFITLSLSVIILQPRERRFSPALVSFMRPILRGAENGHLKS